MKLTDDTELDKIAKSLFFSNSKIIFTEKSAIPASEFLYHLI